MGMVIVHVVLEKFAYHVGDSRDHTPVGREAVAIILDSARCWGGIIRICVFHHQHLLHYVSASTDLYNATRQ